MSWRDLRVKFGHVFETRRCSDGISIHFSPAMSSIFGHFFLNESLFLPRLDSRLAGYEPQEPAPFKGSRGDDLDTGVDRNFPGYEPQEPAPYDGSPGELIDERALSLAGYEPQEPAPLTMAVVHHLLRTRLKSGGI